MSYTLTVKHGLTPELMKTLSNVAVENRLYVPGWVMKDEFDAILADSVKSGVRSVSIIYVQGHAIGAAVTRKTGYMHLFVKKDFRRIGFGKTLAESVARKNSDMELKYVFGASGSKKFFQKCDIDWTGTKTI